MNIFEKRLMFHCCLQYKIWALIPVWFLMFCFFFYFSLFWIQWWGRFLRKTSPHWFLSVLLFFLFPYFESNDGVDFSGIRALIGFLVFCFSSLFWIQWWGRFLRNPSPHWFLSVLLFFSLFWISRREFVFFCFASISLRHTLFRGPFSKMFL